MPLGVYRSENFWSSVSQTMLQPAGWQAVAILYTETVFVFTGDYSLPYPCV